MKDSRILFETNDINEDKFKEYMIASYHLGQLNPDKSFDDICGFVRLKPSPIADMIAEEKVVRHNTEVIRQALFEKETEEGEYDEQV